MSVSQLPLFSMLRENMRWLGQRQSVLAENVANADTPGYRARDLAAQDFAAMLNRSQAGMGAGSDSAIEEQRDAFEVTLSGNSVVLDEQLMKVADTAARHQLAAGLYSKHIALIKMALGGR
ncbi:MAG: flagellar basal body protein [Alphaproteobacteria bacterium]